MTHCKCHFALKKCNITAANSPHIWSSLLLEFLFLSVLNIHWDMLYFWPFVLSSWKSSHNTLSVYRMYLEVISAVTMQCGVISLLFAQSSHNEQIVKLLGLAWLTSSGFQHTKVTNVTKMWCLLHTCTHFSPIDPIHMFIH